MLSIVAGLSCNSSSAAFFIFGLILGALLCAAYFLFLKNKE